MIVRPGSDGGAIKALQRDLNKLGAILLVDGDFGPATGDAVTDARAALAKPGPPEADDALLAALGAVADPFPPLTAAGVTFIARLEVTGPREYRRIYSRPVWPSKESGITLGIGYDLRHVDEGRLRADWGAHLSPDGLALLAAVVGVAGSPERRDLVRAVEVPLQDAVAVFVRTALPRYLAMARSIYPQIDALGPARQTALVSLVYNRGTRLTDDPKQPERQDRREMREIQAKLAAGDVDAVAGPLDAMARLWGPELSGLIARRHAEARLWRAGFPALQLA